MQQKLKVLHVTQYLDIGGLETMVIELCRRLDRTRFDVEILCLNGYDPEYIRGVTDIGIPVHLLRKRHRYDIGYFFRVALFIKKHQIATLHAHSGCFFYAALFALLARVKVFIYTAHGLPIREGFRDIIEDNLASFVADVIAPVSVEIERVLARRMPLARHKLKLIVNGIDTNRFHPITDLKDRQALACTYGLSPDTFWIGSVGRLEPVKNYHMLLRAIARIAEAPRRPIGLVLVGQGSQQDMLKQLAVRLGIIGQIRFLGMQYQVQEILPLLSVFVLSSLTEGTSISLLEAQACGVPAVVTDVGGNGFVVQQGENGFLCAVDDVVAMAEVLCRLRDEPEMVQQMGQAARLRVLDGLDLDSMVQQYQSLYLLCVGGK